MTSVEEWVAVDIETAWRDNVSSDPTIIRGVWIMGGQPSRALVEYTRYVSGGPDVRSLIVLPIEEAMNHRRR